MSLLISSAVSGKNLGKKLQLESFFWAYIGIKYVCMLVYDMTCSVFIIV